MKSIRHHLRKKAKKMSWRARPLGWRIKSEVEQTGGKIRSWKRASWWNARSRWEISKYLRLSISKRLIMWFREMMWTTGINLQTIKEFIRRIWKVIDPNKNWGWKRKNYNIYQNQQFLQISTTMSHSLNKRGRKLFTMKMKTVI